MSRFTSTSLAGAATTAEGRSIAKKASVTEVDFRCIFESSSDPNEIAENWNEVEVAAVEII